MRVSLWSLAFVLAAAGCGSSSSTAGGAPDTQPGHPEGLPEEGVGGTENDLGPEAKGGGGALGGAGAAPGSMGGSGGMTNPTPENPAQYLSTVCGEWFAQQAAPVRAAPADSNGTVSAARADEALALGLAPAPSEIRRDHFFNFYSTPPGDPTNANGMVITMKLRKNLIPGVYDLFVGVRAPKLPPSRSVLTVVVDTTPSMTGVPLSRAGFVLEALSTALKPGDKVVLLTTDPKQGEKTFESFGEGSLLALEAKKLEVSQEADVLGSLTTAYAKANAGFDSTALNRVLFITDGAEPSSSLPQQAITAGAEKGIFLVGIGAGPTTTYRQRLLERATFDGRGSYVYVSNWDSAQREIVARYSQLMGIAYDDVRLELNLPWYLHRIDEEPVSAVPGSYKKQYLAPGASLSFLFRLQACHKDAFLKEPTPLEAIVHYYDPATQVDDVRAAQLTELPLDKLASAPELDKALAIQSYAEALQSLDAKRVEHAQELTALAVQTDPDIAAITANIKKLAMLLQQ